MKASAKMMTIAAIAVSVALGACHRGASSADSAAANAIAPEDVAPPVAADTVAPPPVVMTAPARAPVKETPPPAAPAPKVTQTQQIQDDADAVGMTARTDTPATSQPTGQDAAQQEVK